MIRSWRLTRKFTESVTVATGPGRTVWVGFRHTLRRVNTTTGATVAVASPRVRRQIVDVATDPSRRHLYAALGGTARNGAALREYSARTGHLLARQNGGSLRFSAGGAQLTAVPRGVWAWFRTGMAGQTVLLRRPGLRYVSLSGDLFGWFMAASTVYGGGSLWAGTEGDNTTGGRIGCVAPSTGKIRAQTTLRRLAPTGQLLVVRASAREVIAAGAQTIFAVTAPARCWR